MIAPRLLWLLLGLTACAQLDNRVHHPVTHQRIHTVHLDPIDNLTVYDEEPLTLERLLRARLRQRYALDVLPEKGDIGLQLVFLHFRRGSLRLAEGDESGRTLNVQAELHMIDKEGNRLDSTRLSENETYEDSRPRDFELARKRLLDRLADRLVVDLFEQ